MAASSVATSMPGLSENVDKLRFEHPAKFRELVLSHLSIHLELNGAALEVLLDDDDPIVDSTTSKNKMLKKRKHKVFPSIKDQFFGSVLTSQHLEILQPIFEYLSKPENLRLEGIFRKTGNVERQMNIRQRLEAGERIDFDSGSYTAHDCAGVLKGFMGDLPDCLLSSKHLNAYSQVAVMRDEAKQLATLQLLIQLLPRENLVLLQQLLKLLKAVADVESNLMNENNLAIVFTVHLIVPRTLNMHEKRCATEMLTAVLTFMIRKFNQLFLHPTPLILDVIQYRQRANSTGAAASSKLISTAESRTSEQLTAFKTKKDRKASVVSCARSSKKNSSMEEVKICSNVDDDIVITSSVVFVDRKASTEAAETNNTVTAVAELCAQIASMPESSRKRELVGRVQKTYRALHVVDGKQSMSKSFKEMLTGLKQRRTPLNSIVKSANLHNGSHEKTFRGEEDIGATPTKTDVVKRLFVNEERTDEEQQLTSSAKELGFTALRYNDEDEVNLSQDQYDDTDDEEESSPSADDLEEEREDDDVLNSILTTSRGMRDEASDAAQKSKETGIENRKLKVFISYLNFPQTE